MAEYINKEKMVELYNKYHSSLATKVYEFGEELNKLPIADVIERSKIDKAISEISEYASIWTSYTMDMSKEQIAERCLDDCKQQFLDILKKNIESEVEQ